jgi:hypothetical protein
MVNGCRAPELLPVWNPIHVPFSDLTSLIAAVVLAVEVAEVVVVAHPSAMPAYVSSAREGTNRIMLASLLEKVGPPQGHAMLLGSFQQLRHRHPARSSQC